MLNEAQRSRWKEGREIAYPGQLRGAIRKTQEEHVAQRGGPPYLCVSGHRCNYSPSNTCLSIGSFSSICFTCASLLVCTWGWSWRGSDLLVSWFKSLSPQQLFCHPLIFLKYSVSSSSPTLKCRIGVTGTELKEECFLMFKGIFFLFFWCLVAVCSASGEWCK